MLIKKHNPPLIGKFILRLLLNHRHPETLLGDFEEGYNEIIQEKGLLRAQAWYWLQIVTTLPSFIHNMLHWNTMMLQNYIKIAARNLLRQKSYSFINIFGLAVGMASSILILLWVHDEMSFDRFNRNVNEIHIVRIHHHYADGTIRTGTPTPGPLAPELKEAFPEIVNSTRFFLPGEMFLRYGEIGFYEAGIAGADPSFFSVFTFPFVKGEPGTALNDPFSIVLTEEMADKYFGDEDPIGKVLKLNNRYDFQVTGVIENVPMNSHIRFDFLVPFNFIPQVNEDITGWDFFRCNSYILLQRDTPYREISQKISGYLNDIVNLETEPELFLVPLARYHLYEEFGGLMAKLVYLFSIVALLILLIACINFMNLSTARALKRSKEVGIRKVAGASRFQLIRQFLGESILNTTFAALIALLLVSLILPAYNSIININNPISYSNLTRKQLSLDFSDISLILSLMGIVVLTGLISGSYPALYLSSFNPVKVIKGTIFSDSKSRSSGIRKGLVVTQFSVSIILLICTIFVFKQLDLIRSKDIGFDKENIIYTALRGDIRENYEPLKRELLQNPDVMNVAISHELPTFLAGSGWYWSWEGKVPGKSVRVYETSVDYDFFETYNIQLSQGRIFSSQRGGITDNYRAVIINEEAVRVMGMKSPVGKKIFRFETDYTIIGVVKDFHHLPIALEIGPLVFLFRAFGNDYMSVKIREGNTAQTVNYLRSIFRKHSPDYPFEYKFLAEDVDILYQFMRPVGRIIYYFTILAVFISCLGLFGLASYMAETRTKEIGIKKVLGASVPKIIFSLTGQFVKSVFIANIIALPLAYFLVKILLQGFAYRTNLDLWIFIVVGMVAFAISLITVGYQTIKAARADPVDSLKYE